MSQTETRRTRRDATVDPAKRTRRGRRAVVGALVMLLALLGVGLLWLEGRFNSMTRDIADPFEELPTRPAVAATGPVNVLVLGSDSRMSAGDPSQWQAGAQRTDAIMIMQLNGARNHVGIMSIPRDTWVDVPGHGMAKINAAYSYGGPTLTIQTVEQLTGIHIDHFAITDFESFADITDALGGVTMYLSQPLETSAGVVPAGEQRLTGDQALQYVRERYNLSGGDFSRVQRQQAWMRAMMSEVFEQGILTDLGELTDLVGVVSRSVSVDDGLDPATMVDLAWSARELRPHSVQFMTVPYAGTGTSADGQSIVLLDEAKSQALFAAFAGDTLFDFLLENPDGAVLLHGAPE